MQMIWKINKKFEIWQKKKQKTNRQTKNNNNDDDKKKNTPSYSQRQGQHYDKKKYA